MSLSNVCEREKMRSISVVERGKKSSNDLSVGLVGVDLLPYVTAGGVIELLEDNIGLQNLREIKSFARE